MVFATSNNTLGSFRNSCAAFVAALLFTLSVGCETMSQADQAEVVGGVIGGVVGAQIGDGRGRTVAIIVGTLAGAMIGRHIGETMDDADRMKTANTLNESRTGEATTWVNPDTGYEYTVTPTRTFEESGGPCREFRLDATIGNQPGQDVYGTACLQSDGSWLLVR
jgi:surface antigen